MAVTVTTLTPYPEGFLLNATSSDWSGCEEILAAVTGKSIYLEKITVLGVSAINVTIGEGETTSAVTTTIVGPIYTTTSGVPTVIEFKRPHKLAASTALTADASASGAITIIVEGFVE